jgi:hypothetical protein
LTLESAPAKRRRPCFSRTGSMRRRTVAPQTL